jgi:hypothetical protein
MMSSVKCIVLSGALWYTALQVVVQYDSH